MSKITVKSKNIANIGLFHKKNILQIQNYTLRIQNYTITTHLLQYGESFTLYPFICPRSRVRVVETLSQVAKAVLGDRIFTFRLSGATSGPEIKTICSY